MKACEKDIGKIAPLILQLWHDNTLSDAENILKEYICGEKKVAIAHVADNNYVGLALCCLRQDYVEGCDSSPVGYLEGIVVDKKYRSNGIARALYKECEEWAKEQGCREFASDCELANEQSLKFHLSVGFKEENRIICFRKEI